MTQLLSRREWLRLTSAGVLGCSVSGWLQTLAADIAAHPQRRLAHALGIKPQAYNSWEQGKTLPRLDHLWCLARYYRVSLDRLCGYERDAEATAGIECRKDEDVIDETPMAYKSIDQVMEAQRDLVEIVHTLRQVVCVKG